MRKIAAVALLIAACAAPNVVNADGMEVKYRAPVAHGCGFGGRLYRDGEFCTLECHFASCITQTCHHGHWVIPPATCLRGFGCSQFCQSRGGFRSPRAVAEAGTWLPPRSLVRQ